MTDVLKTFAILLEELDKEETGRGGSHLSVEQARAEAKRILELMRPPDRGYLNVKEFEDCTVEGFWNYFKDAQLQGIDNPLQLHDMHMAFTFGAWTLMEFLVKLAREKQARVDKNWERLHVELTTFAIHSMGALSGPRVKQ